MNGFKINRIKIEEYNTILYYIGCIIILLGLFMLIPLGVAIIFHDLTRYFLSFLVSGNICFIVGIILLNICNNKKIINMSFKGSLMFVMLIWLITAFFSALPFIISGDLSFIDAYFESMSGITSTGFTLYGDKILAYSIAFWRSFLQWFGGLGIIFLLLVIVPSNVNLKRLYMAEGRTEQMNPNIFHNATNFIKIYLILTIIGISLYILTGLSVFDAVCYSFTALGTGGFSVNPTNLDNFINPYIQLVTLILMIMGATNFLIHYRVMKRDFLNITKDIELRAFYLIIISATIIISLNLYFEGYYNHDIIIILRHSLFQVTSVLTSTGFQSTNIDLWTPFSYHVLVILMFIGGCACSTASGIKVYNIAIMFKSILWEIEQMFLPRNVILKRKVYHYKSVKEITLENITTIQIYIFMYIFIFLISSIIVLMYTDLQTAYTVVAASVGNTGLAPSYIDLNIPIIVKITLIFDFFVGRIGIWPILLPLLYSYNKIK